MFTFAVDYFILVFVASLGVMQTAASIGGLRGLLVFKNPLIARPLGIIIAIAAIVWFFMGTERNINDYAGGLDSNEQGLLFFLAVTASGIFTCGLTSLVNWRMADSRLRENDGRGCENYEKGRRNYEKGERDGGNNYIPLTLTLSLRERGLNMDDGANGESGGEAQEAGLGALRHSSWWQALARNYRYWFSEARCWRTQIKRYFSG